MKRLKNNHTSSKFKKIPMKTALFLLIVFILLGVWAIPTLNTRHYDKNETVDYFPIVSGYTSSMKNPPVYYPEMITIAEINKETLFWTEKTDFEIDEDVHAYFRPLWHQQHYELKLVSPIVTQVYQYQIVDNQIRPISMRSSGLTTWIMALFGVAILAITIAVGQVLIGLSRSVSLTPKMKKIRKRQRYK